MGVVVNGWGLVVVLGFADDSESFNATSTLDLIFVFFLLAKTINLLEDLLRMFDSILGLCTQNQPPLVFLRHLKGNEVSWKHAQVNRKNRNRDLF